MNSLIRPHHESRRPDQGSGRRHRRAPDGERRRHFIPLTPEGVPAATPDAPKPSPVVLVAEDARARYPWLPTRVIAGSVWSGPGHVRLRVTENGDVAPWPRELLPRVKTHSLVPRTPGYAARLPIRSRR